jgi:hypothetical protein
VRHLITGLSFLAVAAIVTRVSAGDPPALPTYQTAIEEAQIAKGLDGRVELRRCIKNWELIAEERRSVFGSLRRKLEASDFSLLLEVGNSAFGRYEYVAVTETEISSSFHKGEKQLPPDAVEALRKALKTQIVNIQGLAASPVDDGDCYFLTGRLGASYKQVAIYGYPKSDTPAGMIVVALLEHGRDDASRVDH